MAEAVEPVADAEVAGCGVFDAVVAGAGAVEDSCCGGGDGAFDG